MDSWYWRMDNREWFSVKSAYNLIHDGGVQIPLVEQVWSLWSPLKVEFSLGECLWEDFLHASGLPCCWMASTSCAAYAEWKRKTCPLFQVLLCAGGAGPGSF